MRFIDDRERRDRLVRRHRLIAPADDVVEATQGVVCLHSSDPATVYLSLWARTADMRHSHVDQSLYEDKTLLRIVGMRRTMWVVPTPLASLINSSSTTALVSAQRRRVVKMIESAGIAEDGETWLDEVSTKTLEAIAERGAGLATELTKDVPELGEKIEYRRKDGSILGTFGMSTRVLFQLAIEARVIRVRPTGSWVSSQYRWSTMDDWLGHPLETLEPAEARAGLVRHWLRSFGPGTETDIRWWTGWPVTTVRKSLDDVGAVEVRLESGIGLALADDLEPEEGTGPSVALLPSLDPSTMGWKERHWYLGELADVLIDRNGNAGPTIWVDGRIVGGWAQRPTGEIVYELLDEVRPGAVEAIDRRVEALRAWLGDTVVTSRFRSPHVKMLVTG